MVVSPILPYWLRIRYKVYRMLAQLRKHALIEKYKNMATMNNWNKETWTIIDVSNASSETAIDK